MFRPACVHGQCVVGEDGNYCICENGWQSNACDACKPYWACPNQGPDACVLPNECRCNDDEIDLDDMCNNEYLINKIETKFDPKLGARMAHPQKSPDHRIYGKFPKMINSKALNIPNY